MAYVRFPVPEFDYKQFKNMAWQEPSWLDRADIDRLIDRRKKGDTAIIGAYAVRPSDAFFDAIAVRGERRHAVMCVLPNQPVRLKARSRAWAIQRAVVVDSLDPGAMKTIVDWKTTRPIGTTMGPPDGTTIPGGVVFVVCCRQYADHFIGNRTILDKNQNGGHGIRILSAGDHGPDDFHEVCFDFEWDA